jgi:hypothetical protein
MQTKETTTTNRGSISMTPVSGYQHKIGVAISATEILIQPEQGL